MSAMAPRRNSNDFFAPKLRPGHLLAELARSRRVGHLRRALPLLALLLLASVFFWPFLEGRRLITMPVTLPTPQLTMEQPRFSGTDDQNRPFAVRAARATQLPQNLMQVDLEAPEAEMTAPDGRPVAGSASVGRFDQTKKRLWLGGTVSLHQPPAAGSTDATMTFTTTELYADFTTRAVWGDKPTRLTGTFGTIEGQGFRVYDGGKVLLFTGASRAILNAGSGFNLPTATSGNKP